MEPGLHAKPNHERTVRILAWAVLGLIGAWLASSLYFVNIEFDDGYTTIANSQYFLGLSEGYFWQRGPLLAVLLMPAEYVASRLGLHPLNVQAHHALMASLHFAYLVAVWRLLVWRFGASFKVLAAFMYAVPTVVFFSYAPFISHDILPGLIALLMLITADSFMAHRIRRSWWLLVALGAAVALIKHTYALIWVAVLLANLTLIALGSSSDRRAWTGWLWLLLAAVLSGILTWIGYVCALWGSFLDVPLLLRPYHQIAQFITHFRREGAIDEIIYQWVYLRNLSAYGVAAGALAIPGLYFAAISGDRLLKTIAVAWVVLFVSMHLIAFKEVRYLAYLAPLTAFLLVPGLAGLAALRPAYAKVFVLIWLIDLAGITTEAQRIFNSYYRDAVTQFLAPLPTAAKLTTPLVMTERLSFISPDSHAFFGDRYHRISNIIDDQIRLLYGYPAARVIRFPDVRGLHMGMFPVGSILIFVNDVAARVPPIHADNSTSLQDYFVQLIGVAEEIRLIRYGDRYRTAAPSRQPILLLRAQGVTADPLNTYGDFAITELERISGQAYRDTEIQIIAFRVHAACNIIGCAVYDSGSPAQRADATER